MKLWQSLYPNEQLKTNYMKNQFLLLMLFFVFQSYSQQDNALKNDVSQYFESLKGENVLYDKKKAVINKASRELVCLLKPYYLDLLNEKNRYEAVVLLSKASSKSSDNQFKADAIGVLTSMLQDKSSKIVYYSIEAMQNYSKVDFNTLARENLKSLFDKQIRCFDKYILLLGFIGDEQYRQMLLKNSTGKFNNSITWNMRLALARMGDTTSIGFIKKVAEKSPINDNFVNSLVPNMLYTKQKRLVDICLKTVSEDSKNCSCPNPDIREKMLCSYLALKHLARAIENFPIKIDKYGDEVIDNYEITLIEAKQWIKDNPNYKIKEMSY